MTKFNNFVQNNSMFGTIIFLQQILFFLSTMLIIDVSSILHFEDYELNIIIRIFKIPVAKIKVNLITLKYKINGIKFAAPLKLFVSREDEYLLSQIKKNIIDKLYYDDIVIVSNISMLDPDITADVIGISNIVCDVISRHLKSSNRDIKVTYLNTADFKNNHNRIEFDVRVYFTFFDMVFAIIMSLYNRRRYVKENKKWK